MKYVGLSIIGFEFAFMNCICYYMIYISITKNILKIGMKVKERIKPTFYKTSISRLEFINNKIVRLFNG